MWLKNANFLADTVLGRAAAVTEALEKLAETLAGGLPESTRFLLSAIDVDKRRSFYKGLAKLGKFSEWMLVHDRNHDRVDKILSERALILFRKRENLRNDVVKEAMKLYSGKKKDAHFDDLRSSDYL